MDRKNIKNQMEVDAESPPSGDQDGRLKLREISASLHVVDEADGSCRMKQGETLYQTTVHGPISTKATESSIQGMEISVFFKEMANKFTYETSAVESMLKDTIKAAVVRSLHPSTNLLVNVNEMNTDGSRIACAINAVTLALLDAGIPLSYMVAAINAAIVDGKMILDPTAEEETRADFMCTVAFSSLPEREILNLSCTGTVSEGTFDEILEACEESALHLFNYYRILLEERHG